jgi:hypothetical protein
MPLNQRRIIEIIGAEARAQPNRVKDYHDELIHTIGDIITYEREHSVRATNIQKLVTDKCSALGLLLDKANASTSDKKIKQ